MGTEGHTGLDRADRRVSRPEMRSSWVRSDPRVTEEVSYLSSWGLLVKSRWMHTWMTRRVFTAVMYIHSAPSNTHAGNTLLLKWESGSPKHVVVRTAWVDVRAHGRARRWRVVPLNHPYIAACAHTSLIVSTPRFPRSFPCSLRLVFLGQQR